MEQIQMNKELLKAVQTGQLEILKELIAKGADVNSIDTVFGMPAVVQAGKGGLDVIQLLIEKGADINAKDSQQETALTWAIEKNNAPVIDFLISKGADTRHEGKRFKRKDTNAINFFHCIKQDDIEGLKKVIASGFNINTTNKEDSEKSGLFYAVEKGSLTMVTTLVDAGANLNIRFGSSTYPFTVLHDSLEKNLEVTSYLIDKGLRFESDEINEIENIQTLQVFIDKNFETDGCLCAAVRLRSEDQVRILLKKSKNGRALWNGIHAADEKIWKMLMESEIDINYRRADNNQNILFYIAYLEESEFTVMATEMVIKKGIDVNIKIYDDITPLHEAVKYKRVKLIKLLINAGANVNAIDVNGKTPLDHAKTKTIQKMLQQHNGINSLQGGTMPCGDLDIANLEKAYDRKLPTEYVSFIESKTYKKYNGYPAILPSYDQEKGPEVYFSLIREDGLELINLLKQGDDFQEDITNYLPFASIYWGDSKEPQFLVIDASNSGSNKVLMYDHEDGMFHLVAKSIKTFIKKLQKP